MRKGGDLRTCAWFEWHKLCFAHRLDSGWRVDSDVDVISSYLLSQTVCLEHRDCPAAGSTSTSLPRPRCLLRNIQQLPTEASPPSHNHIHVAMSMFGSSSLQFPPALIAPIVVCCHCYDRGVSVSPHAPHASRLLPPRNLLNHVHTPLTRAPLTPDHTYLDCDNDRMEDRPSCALSCPVS